MVGGLRCGECEGLMGARGWDGMGWDLVRNEVGAGSWLFCALVFGGEDSLIFAVGIYNVIRALSFRAFLPGLSDFRDWWVWYTS